MSSSFLDNSEEIDILKYNLLKKEYKILSLILGNLQNVIIDNENILLFSKNQSMKSLNELVKKLNDIYNKSFLDIYNKCNDNNLLTNESIYSELADIKSNENKSEENKSNKSVESTESVESVESVESAELSKSYKLPKNEFDKDKSLLSSEIIDSIETSDTVDKVISSNNKRKNSSIHTGIGLGLGLGSEVELVNNPNNLINSRLSEEPDSKSLLNLQILNDMKNVYSQEDRLNNYGKYSYLVDLVKYNPFDEVKNQIVLLSKIVGFTSIKDIIYLMLNTNGYVFEKKDKSLYNLLLAIFVPLDFDMFDFKEKISINISRLESENIVLFNNQCLVEFTINNKIFKIKGFLKNDPLNIFVRTSQISNNFLYIKKNNFEKIINYIDKEYDDSNITKDIYNKLQKINKDFGKVYLKNMSICEILILDSSQFVSKLYEDYNKFNELTKTQFVKLIKNFTKDSNENLFNMYNTIRLLLLGSEENYSVASLLFNLLKDKKSTNSNEFISNIIYNQLSHICQLKLKKSTFNIKNELDKLKSITTSDIDLKKQVLLSKNMPDHIKKICLEKLEELKNANNETYKIKMYVNILVQFPWPSDLDDNVFKIVGSDKKKSKEFLENIEKRLDSQIFGHKLAKNKTLQILAKLISVQGSHISPIALSGPPGVGKTKFAQVLADCLDISFVQITLGGQNDGELLHGHGYTYSGAQPGLIVKKMVDAGSARCIMYFDELDKCVAKNGQVNELMSILIHLTDPMTNGSFQDRFFQEITFPLNKVIFMFSFNDASKIDKILLDRMEVLDVGSYSVKEKITIANDYLLKQLCKDVGFEHKSVDFNQEVLTKIIEDYTFEPGVRSLKRSLENILLKLNIDKIYQRGIFESEFEYSIEKPIKITFDIATDFLGESKVNFKCIHSKNMIGVVNGLYATSLCSGGIVPIQLTANHMGKHSKFVLKLTGNQKKIMRESILYSFTTAINLLTDEGKDKFFKNYPCGIHIHTPEAATPKDGPSAGVAFTLAFISVMLNLPIDRTIALTGEIDLYGNVSKIGGVKYKVQGAFKAKVNTVFLPMENKEDIEKTQKELPEIFDSDHKCLFIDHVFEVAEKVLIGWDTKKHYIIQNNI